jgi:hypothetical protein
MSCVEVFDGVVGCRREDRGGPRNPMAKTEKEKVAKPKVDRRKSGKSAATVPQPAPVAVTVSESEIARRAFEVYCARGGQPGRALDDWLQAERELTAGQAFDAR